MCIYYLRSIFQIERRDLYEIIEHGYRCPVGIINSIQEQSSAKSSV